VEAQIKDFFSFLKQDKQRFFNFFLTGLLFCLLPTKFSFKDFKVEARAPLLREFNLDLPQPGLYPVNITGQPAPQLTAESILVIDLDSRAIIFQKNPDFKLAPASTTKMMTALVALDFYHPRQILTIDQPFKVGRLMSLVPGEQIALENLLAGLLVQSGNDAAWALAQNYPGGFNAFVQAMNQKARDLNLEATSFKNPAGIDELDHFSTAHDLAVLATELIKNPLASQLVATPEITVTDVTGARKHLLTNVNELLGQVAGLKGIKTGWTTSAGECLIALVERNNQQVLSVVLGSQDRFSETQKIINWVFAYHRWQSIQE
jgi:D-alanyl-D-alanine carboxypeptidase (penicillin-binding protein 5/6)